MCQQFKIHKGEIPLFQKGVRGIRLYQKKIYFGILFLIISANLYAQNSDFEPRFLVGAKGGMNFFMLKTDLRSDFVYDQAPVYGLKFMYQNERRPALLAEVNLVQKGGQNFFDRMYLADTSATDIGETYYNLSLKYIEIPILAQISFGKKNSKIRTTVGPHLSYLLNQKLVFTETSLSDTLLPNSVKSKFEFGINIGLGYAFAFPKGDIALEIRYSRGLTSLYDVQSINEAMLTQNQCVSATLSYAYNFLKATKPERKKKIKEEKINLEK